MGLPVFLLRKFATAMRPPLYFIIFMILCLPFTGRAQAVAAPDTTLKQVVSDTLQRQKAAEADQNPTLEGGTFSSKTFQPNAKKSGMFSAILPGLGQAYNRQYWKLPVIYAGVGASAYFIHFNNKQYQEYRKAYIARIDSDPGTSDPYVGIYTTDALKQLQDGYKQYLDLTVLVSGLGYILQVMDAVVYAHLKNFDISPDLSMRIAPVISPSYVGVGFAIGLK